MAWVKFDFRHLQLPPKNAIIKIVKSKKIKIRFRPSLFWDVDVKTIDLKKHAAYIIERILQFGTDTELRWLVHQYKPSFIKKIMEQSRGVLLDKTKNLWSLVFKQSN